MAELSHSILRDIGAVARIIQAVSDIRLRKIGLHKGQFLFLTRICEHPGVNQIQLSQILFVDKTTTTKAVQKLMGLGYIRRQTDPIDRRAVRLFPSDEGVALYHQLIEQENADLKRCLLGFSAEEEIELPMMLERMRENLESLWTATKGY